MVFVVIEWKACIKSDFWVTANQGIVVKPFIIKGVVND